LQAGLIVTVLLPSQTPSSPRGIYDRTTRGLRIFLAIPRLRGLIGLNLAVAAAGAMAIVNTGVIVRGDLGLSDAAVAVAMGAFGTAIASISGLTIFAGAAAISGLSWSGLSVA